MKFLLLIALLPVGFLFASCGTLPEKPEFRGPQSSESNIPWNHRRPGEGQSALGGLGR